LRVDSADAEIARTVSEHLSVNCLPQPVVLTVGDEMSYFSNEVWCGVVEASHEGDDAESQAPILWEELEPILDESYAQIEDRLGVRDWGRRRRPPTRTPVPLQLTHGHGPDPNRLHDQIRTLLDFFDVWGVIASASAGHVKPLRDALHGIDVPLLVTTDSTTVKGVPQPANELRLMPSNTAQATAMLFTAVMSEGGRPAPPPGQPRGVLLERPVIAYSCDDMPQARDYVSDLREELRAEAGRLDIPLDAYDERHDHNGPVIVIGYGSHVTALMPKRKENRLTILSDGCATEQVYNRVMRKRADNAEFWFVTRPDVTLRNLGRKSFAAIAEAGRRMLTWDARSTSEKELPRTSRRDTIKQILEDTDNVHFAFNGIENVAPAYRVVPMRDEGDLTEVRPPKVPEPEEPSEQGLRVIAGGRSD
jgi:hypothetical protein